MNVIPRLLLMGMMVFWLILTSYRDSIAQKTVVTGQVSDIDTNEPIPFVNVYLKGTTQGAITDFEGNYKITFQGDIPNDTLYVSYIGYEPKYFLLTRNHEQVLNFALKSSLTELSGVEILSGENPAFAIIKAASMAKRDYNISHTEGYEYESYNRTELYLSKISGVAGSKVMAQLESVLSNEENRKQFHDEKGRLKVPFLVMETVSNMYYLKSPESQKEEIASRKVSGIGISEEDGVIKVLQGNGFRDYNFLNNRVRILDKYVPSPIADGWRTSYDYDLLDSLYIEDDYCYKIKVFPRSELDIAFEGMLWIRQKDFTLKKVDLKLPDRSIINFVESLHIQQTLEVKEDKTCVPVYTDYQIALSEFSEKFPGIILHYNTTDNNFKLNQPRPARFFDLRVSYATASVDKEEEYWKTFRGNIPKDSAQKNNSDIYNTIDTLSRLPSLKKYTRIGKIFGTGYYDTKYIDFGHLAGAYAYNNIEASRITVSLRTNRNLSKTFMFKTWVAYGTGDEKYKYSFEANYTPRTKHLTFFGLKHTYNLRSPALIGQVINVDILFEFFSYWGRSRQLQPYYYRENELWFEKEIFTGFRPKVTLRQVSYNAIPNLNQVANDSIKNPLNFGISEIEFALRYTHKEQSILRKDNTFKNIGLQKYPTFRIRGILGFKDVLGSNYEYQKVILELFQKQREVLGLGQATFGLSMGYIFNKLPFPLLKNHIGNHSPFLFLNAFQNMNAFEFISDHYVEFYYTHFFNGLFVNRIPLIKTLVKWTKARLTASTNLAWGGLRQENRDLIPSRTVNGTDENYYTYFKSDPYWEVGYGFENIFRFLRIDFFHRLTYLDNPRVHPFQIKLSAAVKF